MGKANKKTEGYRLVLPEKSRLLFAAAACAAVNFLLNSVMISTESGGLAAGFSFGVIWLPR